MKILVAVPDLQELGGVANYYRILEGGFENAVTYFQVGSWQGVSARPFFSQVVQALSDAWNIWKVSRAFDVVHFNPSLSAKCFFREMMFTFVAKLAGCKVIIFVRGWNTEFAATISEKLSWVFCVGYAKVDAFVVLASEFREKIEDWGYKGPVYLETTVVDESVVPDVRHERQRGGKIRLLYMARLERAKGIFDSLDALSSLPQDSYELKVAGDGNERAAAVHYVEEHRIPGVEFCGWLSGPEKISALEWADIFLFPSQYGEGMPNSVLEAMAFGLVVITSGAGGVKDFFENGVMGYLLDPVNPERIADCVLRCIEDSEMLRSASSFNSEYAIRHFGSSQVIKRLEGIYEEVYAGQCRPDLHQI